jgi:glycosyltransferase involved in cell wall biosynthesis
MRKPRLIFINRFFHPDETATSQILTDLCFHLADNGWHVRVIASNVKHDDPSMKLPRLEIVNGVEVSRVWSPNFGKRGIAARALDYLSFYPSASIRLLRLCAPGDIVVTKTDPPLISIPVSMAVLLKGGKLVNWVQDLYPEVAARLGVRLLNGPLGSLLTYLRNITFRRASANVVIGAGMSRYLITKGVDASRIHVIPNWADEQAILPIPSSASLCRTRWSLKANIFVLGYSGNFGLAHESETILKAALLLRDRQDICFLFVGGGQKHEHLVGETKRLKLGNFLFKPLQPREDLSQSLAAADAHWVSLRPELEELIVPSKFYGIACAGRPVIAVTSSGGEIAQAVRRFQCGYVVEPGDGAALACAIVELADNPKARTQMGERARQAAEEQFTRQSAFNRWENLLAFPENRPDEL